MEKPLSLWHCLSFGFKIQTAGAARGHASMAAGMAAEEGACCKAGCIWGNLFVPLLLPHVPHHAQDLAQPSVPRAGPAAGGLGSPTASSLWDGQVSLELVPSRSRAPGVSGACTRAWLPPQAWSCCRGCRGRRWGPAARAGSRAPHGPQHPVIWGNRKRGAGRGLSCPPLCGHCTPRG